MADKPQPAKPGIRLKFEFIPMPIEVLTASPALSLVEWMVLAYLLKQVRFGESLEPISDSAIISACSLSRNAIKIARSKLCDRGWISAVNVSNDPSRPKWHYRLVITSDSNTVTERQALSQRDSAVSRCDSAVSRCDSAVSRCDSAVSQRDTCNKEEEYLIESTNRKSGEITAPPASVTRIQQERFIKAIPEGWRQAERFAPASVANPREHVYNQVRIGAKSAALPYTEAKLFLADHPLWRDWPDLRNLDAQQEITFPETVAPKSNKKQLPELNRGDGHNAWEYIVSVLKVSPHSRDTWIKPLRPLGVAESILYVKVPTHEFKHVGEKFPALLSIARERNIENIYFVDAETYEL